MNEPLIADFNLDDRFPPVPDAVLAIERIVENPESSFEDIAVAIEGDETLAKRLLKLANSKFYGYPIAITNVPDALSVVGLRNIRNLSLALLLPDALTFPTSSPIKTDAFWRYSIAVGICARLMALECREANTERHFLAGFLHKIGRPLLARIYPQAYNEVIEKVASDDVHFNTVMQVHLGTDESLIASHCLKSWRFPSNIENLVRYHNKPVLSRQNVRGVSLVHIASFAIAALDIGESGDRFVPEFSEAAWGYASFEYSKLSLVVSELLSQLDDVCDVFLSPVD